MTKHTKAFRFIVLIQATHGQVLELTVTNFAHVTYAIKYRKGLCRWIRHLKVQKCGHKAGGGGRV